MTYDFGEDLDHILEGQNAFAWFPALVSAPVRYEVTPKAVYDKTKLEQALQEIVFSGSGRYDSAGECQHFLQRCGWLPVPAIQ